MDYLKVQVVESSFVVPSEPTPTKALWLSCLDMVQSNKAHTPTIHLYSSNDAAAADFFDLGRLKKATAKALVAFYPLAGRLVDSDDGRKEISCNGEGALFVVARADGDLTIDEVKKFKPSPELRRLFIPLIEPSSIIMAIQVTFLKCGGVVLGTAIHHAATDVSSAFHFFQTWSAFCKHGDSAAVELPCHDRTLLRARSPPTVHPDALSTLQPRLVLTEPEGPLAIEIFTISRDHVASLKQLCGGTSTFCAVSALIWQCACVARRIPPDSQVRVMFPADVRRRMRPPLPTHYFGNAVIRLYAAGPAGDIGTAALASVAARIKGAVERMDDELVRSAIDYYEMAETNKRRTGTGILPRTDLNITSWLGRPQHDADFGWGKPQSMSRAESVRGGSMHLMNDDGGTGDVRVLVCLEAENIKELGRLLYAKL
ncbi:spermidine hydroxycinnamoyl transferase isoform X1 [Zea mays]|uniref:Spermidine hydroxycinnamoyl transferase n=2 Tax=Zea mays TaxID=4577 RepID=B4FRQ8_MAIZE|nr:Spermidine hydroxycinnamoyl transferase [Zea mays]XP_008672738.1 spermidine hydroxycinnamoyl transferase isoform X1 [Zea mays]ACF84801.1 unknown [Zea mays]ACF85553.1 unknown [Zea mays]ACL53860.1 unknown [Zea mays]ACN37073.1 unknown [Zea mays]ONM29988.1 Spermidine hydroxycinnamoyl transferase [Zea mays]|eukprot:NP_001146402.1 Spermidine hydroxycinnamoyl transferase [Zea mays]